MDGNEREFLEIERKFLVDASKLPKNLEKGYGFVQGYILTVNKDVTVRVRLIRLPSDKKVAYITFKNATKPETSFERLEIEEALETKKAELLLKEFCDNNIIEKTRYRIKYDKHIWEVDQFHGKQAPLWLAEIELTSADEPFEKPLWLGEEVTNKKEFTNCYLALKR